MSKYNIYFTKEDAKKAYALLEDLEKKLKVELNWKAIKRQSGDSIATIIDILKRQLRNQETNGRFKIYWLENTEKTGKELKDFMETLPNPKITGTYPFSDELTEIECYDVFEAKNIEEAKKKIKEDYYEVEIFTVFDNDSGERLFTEEDME